MPNRCRIAQDRRTRVPEGYATARAAAGAAREHAAVAEARVVPVALAVDEVGGQEAEELACDSSVGAVPGGARRGVSEASAGLALDPLLVLSQPTLCGYKGAGEGLRPFEPGQARAPVDCAGGGDAPVPPWRRVRMAGRHRPGRRSPDAERVRRPVGQGEGRRGRRPLGRLRARYGREQDHGGARCRRRLGRGHAG